MFEMSMIHRPGMVGGQHNLGRILESMLYYDRVHLMMDGQLFIGLWDILGPDDFKVLLSHPTITTTLTSQMLGIKSEVRNAVVTHLPVAFKMGGRNGQQIDEKDDVGTLVHLISGLPNRQNGTRAQVSGLVNLTKRSRYHKILGGEAGSRARLVALAKDQDTLKLFLRGWAIANGQSVNEAALKYAKINTVELGLEFMIFCNVPLEMMVSGWNPSDNWATILTSMQDYAIDLYLSNSYSADIVTSPEISEIASARIDLGLQRAHKNAEQISAFEDLVFEEARCFGDAFNNGSITFAESLKVIDQSRRFRTWARGLAPDADLIYEYHRAIAKDTILKNLPVSIARFAIFNGAGAGLGTIIPGAGLIASAIDSFIVERIFGGWKPNVFVRNLKKSLARRKD